MEKTSAPTDSVVQYFMNIRLNKSAELSQLAREDPTLVSRVSRDGFNGLHLACKYGFESIAEILLEYDILTDEVDHKYGRTFLHWACMQGHNDILLTMMRNHHSKLCLVLDYTDKDGHTALMLAVKSGRVETAMLLLVAGARTDIKVLKAGVERTVVDMCTTSDLAQLVSNATAPGSTSDHQPMCAVKQNGMNWGFTTNIGTSISKVANKKSKYITHGWMKQSVQDEAHNALGTNNSKTRDVIVKLNKDPRELQQELAVRQLLLRHVSSTVTTACTDSGDAYFVQALHSQLLAVPNQPDIWHAILLEKGITDVHHLYDSMCQKATYSRLHDIRWKLWLVQQVCSVCKHLLDAGMVWYDLKPSNLIVFPASHENKKASDAAATAHNNISNIGEAHAGDTKLYKWLQNSRWDAASISVKATDLSSLFTVDDVIYKAHISCTAKFLCPSVAQAMTNADVTEIVADPAHMMWALGMTILQLLHTESKTFYAHHEVGHADQVYAFLRQDRDALQLKLDTYVDEFVHSLVDLSNDERGKVSALLKGLLRVVGAERMSIQDACALVASLSNND